MVSRLTTSGSSTAPSEEPVADASVTSAWLDSLVAAPAQVTAQASTPASIAAVAHRVSSRIPVVVEPSELRNFTTPDPTLKPTPVPNLETTPALNTEVNTQANAQAYTQANTQANTQAYTQTNTQTNAPSERASERATESSTENSTENYTKNSAKDSTERPAEGTRAPAAAVSPKIAPATPPVRNIMSTVQEALNHAMTIEGALGVTMVDLSTGLTLGMAGGSEILDLEIASAGNSDVLRAKLRTLDALGIDDRIEDILITLTNQYHLVRVISSGGGGLFLYLVLDKQRSNLAMARHRLTQIEQSMQV